jgi:hypothetical protein
LLIILSDQERSGSVPSSPARGIVAQVVANASLLIAVLVYMGWAYDDAVYGYFHLNPLNLNIGIIEYMLVSLSLFKPVLVIAAAVLIFVSAARTWNLGQTRLARFVGSKATSRSGKRPLVGSVLLTGAGATAMGIALVLAAIANLVPINTYVVLGLLGGGSLLLTWPTRADRRGHFPYALAIVLAAVCALWAASLYAHNRGTQVAEQVVRDLPARTAVALYTVHPLALSGPGVKFRHLPAGSLYRYRYEGLRLLTMRSDIYYLLPVGWSPHLDFTYILNVSDQIRIELYQCLDKKCLALK